MWWLIWVVLVLAALGVGVLLALRLWRQVKALGREARGLSDAAERLERAGDDDVPARPRHVPGVVGEESTLDRARATRERVKVARSHQRQGRLERSAARWRRHGLLDGTPAPSVVRRPAD
ncbi:hypothetical protein [Georgenia daeguensis]|uniref:Uncharacterized protein n=1 Tax=Georgenia daeguensis TaxID=908355 RepID=A0ABP6UM87_9MICO